MPFQETDAATSTGASTAIALSPTKDVSYTVTQNTGSDANVDVEVQLTTGGTWHKEVTGVTIGEVRTLDGPVIGIRQNVISLGAAATVTLEVLAAARYG